VRPLVPVSTGAKVVLGVAFFVLFFAAWAAATLGGYVNRTFLADPLTMVRAGWLLLTVHGFYEDIGVTIWRVFGGFALAAAAGVPLGIVMGAYKPIEAFFEPFISFARYLPASGFIPLLILWAGIGETEKLMVIFIGSFFQLVLMVADEIRRVPCELVQVSQTLGASRGETVRLVLFRGALPGIFDALPNSQLNALSGIRQTNMSPTDYIDNIDGPGGVGAFSKDLAFELYTVPEPV